MNCKIEKSKLVGKIICPANKSYTHRAIFLAALSDGKSIVKKILRSNDTIATINACRGFGVEVEELENNVDEKDYYIIKNFTFNNFLESQSFVNKVGEIAEQEGHHPDIWFGWGYAKIKIQTHAINGLHESDFVLAAKIDRID